MRRILWLVLLAVVPLIFATPVVADTNITITANPSYATEAPTVLAGNATGITSAGATLHGNVTDNGGGTITTRGFEWGFASDNYTLSWNETGSFSAGAFSHGIGNLTFCTDVFWIAFAVNDYGRGNSTEQSFTTVCLPSAPTDFTVTQIGINSANITWTKGTAANTTVIIVGEGECPEAVDGGVQVYSGNGTGVIVGGLMFEMTTYCYRAWSHNDYGYSVDYAEASVGDPIGIPSIMFVAALCGFALWKKDWIRILLSICIIIWGAFAMQYDVKIAAPLLALGTILFIMSIMKRIQTAREA